MLLLLQAMYKLLTLRVTWPLGYLIMHLFLAQLSYYISNDVKGNDLHLR